MTGLSDGKVYLILSTEVSLRFFISTISNFLVMLRFSSALEADLLVKK